MNYFSNTALGRFRLIAVVEGISYLVLLFIAMPVKYLLDAPAMVTYTGWAHGVLFMLYILALIPARAAGNWGFWKTFIAFIASLIPFATFALDKNLRKEELRFTEVKEGKTA